jgi:two-component system, NtrC family, response regulator GlrR
MRRDVHASENLGTDAPAIRRDGTFMWQMLSNEPHGSLEGLEGSTLALRSGGPATAPTVRRFRLTVVEGPGRGATWESAGPTAQLGSHESNDLVLADPTVSRFHCEIRIHPDAAHVHDLGSTNGTILDGVQVVDGLLRGDSLVRMGASVVRFSFAAEQNPLPISEHTRFGSLSGASAAMRATFAMLERAAASHATVLLEGETGTGKSQAARSLHRQSPRRDGPFITIDCGAIPGSLLESELFGHERGAFTGAVQRHLGTFEAASGGTIFLDELGEMPAELQPKLLRALEERQIRRVGGTASIPVDVRVIAATNRDLRAEVNAGRFRSDLYFRLAVVRITLPSLRQRPEDLPALVDALLESLDADPELAAPLRTPEFLAQLARASWPGNVRELRNHLERCLVMQDVLPLGADLYAAGPGEDAGQEPAVAAEATAQAATAATSPARSAAALGGSTAGAAAAVGPEAPRTFAAVVDLDRPFVEARERALAAFEREYLSALIAHHGDRTVRAAAAAGVGRVYLYKLLKKHGLR